MAEVTPETGSLADDWRSPEERREDERRRAAYENRDLNVERIADALERIADAFETALMPEPSPDEREQDPGPDDAPASPEDAAEWRFVKGGRATLYGCGDPRQVVVDRIYRSEDVDVAVIIDEDGFEYRTPLSSLRPVEALS